MQIDTFWQVYTNYRIINRNYLYVQKLHTRANCQW